MQNFKHKINESPQNALGGLKNFDMKPEKNDKKAHLLFTPDELDFLQENTWQMAESFGLDARIANLTGKRAAGFYAWDLECLQEVAESAKKDAPVEQHPMIDRLLQKIGEAMISVQ